MNTTGRAQECRATDGYTTERVYELEWGHEEWEMVVKGEYIPCFVHPAQYWSFRSTFKSAGQRKTRLQARTSQWPLPLRLTSALSDKDIEKFVADAEQFAEAGNRAGPWLKTETRLIRLRWYRERSVFYKTIITNLIRHCAMCMQHSGRMPPFFGSRYVVSRPETSNGEVQERKRSVRHAKWWKYVSLPQKSADRMLYMDISSCI